MIALSTSPVVTTVHMNASSSNSDSFSDPCANGPLRSSVNHTAIAHTSAFTVATSRCWKRKAAHMTNGRIAKVSGTEGTYEAMPAPNIAYITPDRRQTRRDPSAIFRGVHAGWARAAQARIKGVRTMIPTVSPCHHVHQFHNNAGGSSECTKTSEAPSQIPGQMRLPSSRTDARAIPEGGHTAVA